MRARDERRVIITADLDYPRLLALARAERPGLTLFRGGNYSEEEVKERLGHALALTTDEELPTSLITIERWHIRKRRLPIKAH